MIATNTAAAPPRPGLPTQLGEAVAHFREVLLRAESATVSAGPLHDQVERLIRTFDQIAQAAGLVIFRIDEHLSQRAKPVKTIEVPAGFRHRSRRDETATSRRRIWTSDDGQFRVVYSRCKFGPRRGPQAIPPIWYAERLGDHGWDIISRHRKARPAFAACLAAMRQAVDA